MPKDAAVPLTAEAQFTSAMEMKIPKLEMATKSISGMAHMGRWGGRTEGDPLSHQVDEYSDDRHQEEPCVAQQSRVPSSSDGIDVEPLLGKFGSITTENHRCGCVAKRVQHQNPEDPWNFKNLVQFELPPLLHQLLAGDRINTVAELPTRLLVEPKEHRRHDVCKEVYEDRDPEDPCKIARVLHLSVYPTGL